MKKTLPWLALSLGIIVSTFIWDFISFPYDHTNTISGQYSENKINPLNDTIRGLSFIFIPILFFSYSSAYNNIHTATCNLEMSPVYMAEISSDPQRSFLLYKIKQMT